MVNPAVTLTISGTGITNSSGITQNFVTGLNGQGVINFTNSAMAGSMTAFSNFGALGGNVELTVDRVAPVPEPTTWIGGALGIPFIVFVYFQRRRRAQMLRPA